MPKKAYSIVGINHARKEAFVAALAAGKPAVLVREPDNPFDPLAVSVWIDGEKVGFVPKNQNSILATFIDQTGQPWSPPPKMASDSKHSGVTWAKTIPATFIRSPNSGFPMVEV